MEIESCVPPGFRFHPTDEELVGYYLKRKVNSLKIDLDVIVDIDLYRMEPWDIQERCKLGYEEQNEWYFFSHKDKKYPTGTRTNRATTAGFWKATGRDKAVLSKNRLIGMRKTLVFYKGRAPNGTKTHWIMHEYRLQTSEHAPTQEEGWVVCRAFKKPIPNHKPINYGAWNHAYYLRDNNVNFGGFPSTSEAADPMQMIFPDPVSAFRQPPPFGSSDQDLDLVSHHNHLDHEFPGLLESTTFSTSLATKCGGGINGDCEDERSDQGGEYVDWKKFDNLLAAELAEPAATSFPHPNFPLVSQEYDTNIAQSHANHLFTCFPEF